MRTWIYPWGLLLCVMPMCGLFAAQPIVDDLNRVRALAPEGVGLASAREALARLRESPIEELPQLLDGLDAANALAYNWLRGAVQDVVRRQPQPPLELLVTYAMDTQRGHEGRALAVELIRQADADRAAVILEQSLEDPSLPLRQMAVEQALGRAADLKAAGDEAGAVAMYQRTLAAARHPRQVETLLQRLKDLNHPVRTVDHFGFITRWQTLAPLDNVSGVGFAQVYPPEASFVRDGSIDLKGAVPGKKQSIQWRAFASDADDGKVDLNPAYANEKGAVCYAYTELQSPSDQPAQLRLRCICANKAWVNGQEVLSNEVYHAGSMIDQYVAPIQLKAGTNRLLLKICQNEQTESWAQDWDFQCRVTDLTGKGILSETAKNE